MFLTLISTNSNSTPNMQDPLAVLIGGFLCTDFFHCGIKHNTVCSVCELKSDPAVQEHIHWTNNLLLCQYSLIWGHTRIWQCCCSTLLYVIAIAWLASQKILLVMTRIGLYFIGNFLTDGDFDCHYQLRYDADLIINTYNNFMNKKKSLNFLWKIIVYKTN